VTRVSARDATLPIPAGMTDDRRQAIRRAAGRALVGGLTLAAFVAVLALMGGSFGDTEVQVILTSIGFAVASATAATGASLRLRVTSGLRALGTATVLASALAFVLLVVGLWMTGDEWGSESVWRAFGVAGVTALAGSHACVVLGARRPSDSDAVSALVFASLALAALDTLAAILPISDLVTEVSGDLAQPIAATVVLLVLTTILPPILRRMESPTATAPTTAMHRFAGEVEAVAERIEELNRGPSNRAPEIRREVERLRDLARSFQA
jgi:hypothetical protein